MEIDWVGWFTVDARRSFGLAHGIGSDAGVLADVVLVEIVDDQRG